MISHKHKCIFIHIPSTSGTSIEKVFDVTNKFWDHPETKQEKHWNASQTRKFVGEKVWNDYFKFTVVRNPWDWIISHYLKSEPYFQWTNIHTGKSLAYFLRHFKSAPWEFGERMSDYLDHGELDFIARLENRKEDLKHISEKLGFDVDQNKRERVNSKRKHYTEYYDDESRDIVAEKYAKDIEYFGYEFGG